MSPMVFLLKFGPMSGAASLLASLNKADRFANAGRMGRLLHHPVRYLQAIGYRQLVYPFTQQGWEVSAQLITGHRVRVQLPAATDLYLAGCKTHPSERRLCRYLVQHLQPGAVVVDAGAHVGFFSLLCAHLAGPTGRVLAVEAASAAFQLLQQNTASETTIEPLQAALADTDGSITFYEFPVELAEYNTVDPDQYKDQHWYQQHPPVAVTCAARTGDALLQQRGWIPQLLKLDVEGYEPAVLRGFQQCLQQYSPAVVMEFVTGPLSASPHDEADAFLRQLGYRPHAINQLGQPQLLQQSTQAYVQQTGLRSDNILYTK